MAFDPWNRSPKQPFKTSNTLHVSWKTKLKHTVIEQKQPHAGANKLVNKDIKRNSVVLVQRWFPKVNMKSKLTLFTFLDGIRVAGLIGNDSLVHICTKKRLPSSSFIEIMKPLSFSAGVASLFLTDRIKSRPALKKNKTGVGFTNFT